MIYFIFTHQIIEYYSWLWNDILRRWIISKVHFSIFNYCIWGLTSQRKCLFTTIFIQIQNILYLQNFLFWKLVFINIFLFWIWAPVIHTFQKSLFYNVFLHEIFVFIPHILIRYPLELMKWLLAFLLILRNFKCHFIDFIKFKRLLWILNVFSIVF